MTNREFVYMCLDLIKANSDDSFITEDHVLFLGYEIRNMVLLQMDKQPGTVLSENNYQTIECELQETPAMSGIDCCCESFLMTKEKLPKLLGVGKVHIYPRDFFKGNISYISKERMKYVGHNKWLQNIIYAALGTDRHLYLKSSNPLFIHLSKILVNAIFENPREIDNVSDEEFMEQDFPIQDSLATGIIDTVVKVLSQVLWRPQDDENNAKDDFSNIQSFIRKYMKSSFQKSMEGDQ